MSDKLYCHMKRHYHLYSFIANLFIAVSMAGLTLLGILNDTFAAAILVSWGIAFAVMFGVGKLLDQEIDDINKVKENSYDGSCK